MRGLMSAYNYIVKSVNTGYWHSAAVAVSWSNRRGTANIIATKAAERKERVVSNPFEQQKPYLERIHRNIDLSSQSKMQRVSPILEIWGCIRTMVMMCYCGDWRIVAICKLDRRRRVGPRAGHPRVRGRRNNAGWHTNLPKLSGTVDTNRLGQER